ncbi:MAG TPA: hypothetical protein VF980_01260 [Thermoanaerobaculia bacterium]
MRWLRYSLLVQWLLAIYFQLIFWIPLGSWNAQPGSSPLLTQTAHGQLEIGDLAFVLAFLIPPVIFLLGYRYRIRWLLWASTAGYACWLFLQLKTWWGAYLFGASDHWAAVYERVFSHSTQVLPRFGRHLPPDGLHLVLQLLLCAIVALAVAGLIALPSQRRAT